MKGVVKTNISPQTGRMGSLLSWRPALSPSRRIVVVPAAEHSPFVRTSDAIRNWKADGGCWCRPQFYL